MTDRAYQKEYMRKYRKGEKTAKDNGNNHLIDRLEWKDIPERPGYAASKCGQILSKERTMVRSNGRSHSTPARVLKQSSSTDGYFQVGVYEDTKKKMRQVARLVHEAWHGPIPEGMHVDHIDQNHRNNYADNLQLLTPAANNTKKELHAVKVCYNAGAALAWDTLTQHVMKRPGGEAIMGDIRKELFK